MLYEVITLTELLFAVLFGLWIWVRAQNPAIALVPGLATQQAVRNNLDIRQLFADDWLVEPEMSGIGLPIINSSFLISGTRLVNMNATMPIAINNVKPG